MDREQSTSRQDKFEHRQKELEKICSPIIIKAYSAGGADANNAMPGATQGPTVEEVD